MDQQAPARGDPRDASAADRSAATHDAPAPWPPAVPTAVGPTDLVVLRVTGTERQSYLDAVLSQRLRDAGAGTATAALELGPHGEPTGVLDVAVLEDEVVLLVPAVLADDVEGRLAGRTFLSDAHVTRDDGVTVLRVRGPRAVDDLAAAGLATPPGVAVDADGPLRLGDRHGALLVGTEDELGEVRQRLAAAGIDTATSTVLDTLELVTGRPRAPEEIAAGRLPEELGLLPTHVHLAKGCYPGQEAVARMWQLGRPRRRLVVLSSTTGLAPGPLTDGQRVEVTRAGSVDDLHVGLAFAGRDVAVGDELAPGVVVREVVGDGLPVPGHDPAVARRRDTR